MGIKDEYQFDYLDDNQRFADQVNGALFGGKQIVKAEELEPMEPQSVNLENRAGKRRPAKTVVDKKRLWNGRKIHILVIENQNYVDYQMVFRNMLSESIAYNKQWKQKKAEHERQDDLKKTDEYLSHMKKEEIFTPIITLVVYFGTEHPWDGAKCLYDLLDIDEDMKSVVSNYRLNLYDCQAHDTFEEYQTGLRQVFETARYAKDKEKLLQIMEENREVYSRIDSETKEMIEVLVNVKIPETFQVKEDGEERYDMCKAFEDMKLEGIEIGLAEGMEKGIRALIETCKELGISRGVIIEKCMVKFEMTEEKAVAYAAEYGI